MSENQHTGPRLSLVTVTFNCRDAFSSTLESISRQTYKNIEYIVVDGGSTDGTVDVIRQNTHFINRWVSGKDGGIYDAMNKGIDMATGDYLSFMNAGDFYVDENTLSGLFEGIDPGSADVVYGDNIVFDPEKPGWQTYLEAYSFTRENLLTWGTRVVCHQAFFVKRTLAPHYDLRYLFKAELNWYFDLVEHNPGLVFVHKKLPVVYYATGGMAYKYFWQNQKEYYHLIRDRFGMKAVIKYKHHRKVLYGLTFKYRWIQKVVPPGIIRLLKPKVK